MRTLRYLGVCYISGISGDKADKILETIKGMPEDLGEQEKRHLLSYGIPMNLLKIKTRSELLDYIQSIGRDEYIKIKIEHIEDRKLRIETIRKLIKLTKKERTLDVFIV